MELPRRAGDRIFQGLVSLFMSLVMAIVVLVVFAGWETTDWSGFLIKTVVEEILLLIFSTFALYFIWCLFTPAWVERLMSRRTKAVAIASAVMVFSLLAILLGSAWRESVGR